MIEKKLIIALDYGLIKETQLNGIHLFENPHENIKEYDEVLEL